MFTDNDGALLFWALFVFAIIAGIGKLATIGKPAPAPKVPWTPERAEQQRLAAEAERERRSGWAPADNEDDDQRRRRRQARDAAWEEEDTREKEDREYDEDQARHHQQQEDEGHQQRDDYLNS